MPDFEFQADFKMVAMNGGYLVTCTLLCDCTDPDCNGLRYATFWRNTYQEVCKLLWETVEAREATDVHKLKQETGLKVERSRD